METQTLVALVGVTGALMGSAIGGFISFFATRSVRKMEWKLSVVQKEMQTRESLYADFLTEANRLLMHQVEGKVHHATELTHLVSLDARIWFFSDIVGKAARSIVLCILDANLKDDEKKDSEEKPEFAGLRDTFITECKKDLLAVKSNV